ncbi:glycoside hydrolase family 3 N-terminal domain-containing protein [Actinophytocola gossypii]|uniref:glycoside hydrolase family 3 N-terminal domain-containing protein n=1 Tax=Actinophytocola gossypii TaxID=2812003 RepID=UPI0035CD0BB0
MAALRRRRATGLLLAVAVGAGTALVGVQDSDQVTPGRPVAAPSSAPATSSAPAPTVVRPAPPEPVDACADVIRTLPPRRRLAQLLVVGVDPGSVRSATRVVAEHGVGGIFVGGNDTALLVGDALVAVRETATVPLSVAVDEEGGRVQRIDALDGDLPSARVMARTMTVDQVRAMARERGTNLRARGVTVDFAPVLDVTTQPDDDVVGDRSFGSDPAVVARYATAFALGLADAGVRPVVKHFPGHGRATGDSHVTAVSTPPLAELRKVDLLPYRALLGSAPVAVMVGHLTVPGLTDGLPATLSPATYRLLRTNLNFDGVVMTDDLGGMRAVSASYPLPRAVLTALTAGADIALWSTGARYTGEVLDVLEKALASGRLPPARVDEALHRVLRARGAC